MPRYTRYLRLEKNIAASDTGGILERWTFGRRLLMDGKAMSASRRSLQPGVALRLIAEAKAAGYKMLSEREIQYRLQAARTYETEAQIRSAAADLGTWRSLCDAGFPQVEVADPGEPHDPRDADEKWRDFRNDMDRLKRRNPSQLELPFDMRLPHYFNPETRGPRVKIGVLVRDCDESERMTANYAKRDAEKRAYVNELLAAVDGNEEATALEAEARIYGLEKLGVSSVDELNEIIDSFFDRRDDEPGPDDDE